MADRQLVIDTEEGAIPLDLIRPLFGDRIRVALDLLPEEHQRGAQQRFAGLLDRLETRVARQPFPGEAVLEGPQARAAAERFCASVLKISRGE